MTSLDSMFLFEIELEGFRFYEDVGNLLLKAEFADLFEMYLNNPNNSKVKKLQQKRITKVRSKSIALCKKEKSHTEQAIYVTTDPQLLMNKMMMNNLRFSVWLKKQHEVLGAAEIPWNETCFEYLSTIINNVKISPSTNFGGIHSIISKSSPKVLGMVQLNIRISYCANSLCTLVELSQKRQMNSKKGLSKDTKNDRKFGKIKTLYGGKPKIYSRGAKPKNKMDATRNDLDVDKRDWKLNNDPNCSDSVQPIEVDDDVSIKIAKSLSYLPKNTATEFKPLQYIFGDPDRQFGSKVYCVNFFTVNSTSDPMSAKSSKEYISESSHQKYNVKLCDSKCQVMKNRNASAPPSSCSLGLRELDGSTINVDKCKSVVCEDREHRKLPPPPDDRIMVDLKNLEIECCDDINAKIEEVVGGVKAKMQIGEDPCFCTCECTFGFVKKTTYCKTCGGYEILGEDVNGKERHEKFPCPYYHKGMYKHKTKSISNSGSDSKRKGDDNISLKLASNQKAITSDKKSVESEKDTKKIKVHKDDRFKFNYGYKAPQIGHSKCALPCTGKLGNVPKHMGWLWTAEDIPGMKFRPMWKPGGTNKRVVRLLKIAKNPEVAISKKRKKDSTKKRPLKRPLLVVHKKDGEFTVTMETMKQYSKPRAINQNPYEDKPVVTYTIGRTEEENRERRKKKERKQRRLEREQRAFIQSTFKDMCNEICLKTYQQALGILPDTEDPQCTCYPALPTAERTNLDISCSCSEEKISIGSDTDSDEWFLEFTPPNATFYPNYKTKKIFKNESGTQYTYLDYRVKLLDAYGNPVPRFFKGPDGKEQCSDLGGFWSPDHKWLEINVDGIIAPDGRWAPNSFIGPNGEHVEAEGGKFQTIANKWLVVGIDGYVDSQGRWKFYSKPRGIPSQKKITSKKQVTSVQRVEKFVNKSDTSWSCFGEVSLKYLSELGIIGHSHDKRLLLSSLKDMLAQGENVKIPQPSSVYRLPASKRGKGRHAASKSAQRLYEERTKCNHPVPSDKGIVAVDDRGRKTYFRLKDHRNKRPSNRLKTLAKQGISLSSFHIPCFHSFINSEAMKQQQRDRLIALGRDIATQI
ncbi:unnamed protein product [Leptidea sinapis]|uniref:DUF4776 domain-containing protein n=1 Tax=Leptidea sinapis TaxID=189913 RepID=A0A5E4R0E9_9NEOP|nr:unnamed protein product [Leptidea sinapis]